MNTPFQQKTETDFMFFADSLARQHGISFSEREMKFLKIAWLDGLDKGLEKAKIVLAPPPPIFPAKTS